eukprot:Clim_evm7s156 gene=Clim_evmTU7s156
MLIYVSSRLAEEKERKALQKAHRRIQTCRADLKRLRNMQQRQKHAEAEARLEKLRMAEELRPKKIKADIAKYRFRMQLDKDRQTELEQLRIIQVQRRRAEQMRVNQQRVQQRYKIDCEKKAEHQRKVAQQEADRQRRTKSLNKLAGSVGVRALTDWIRSKAPTTAWNVRLIEERMQREDIKLRQNDRLGIDAVVPNSYTTDQIMKDQRVRLEQRLRKMGLANSEYARVALAMVKPPMGPRRDMTSTIFGSVNDKK